jgi:hypothetical protein
LIREILIEEQFEDVIKYKYLTPKILPIVQDVEAFILRELLMLKCLHEEKEL